MKKNLFLIIMALFTGFLTSCSNEETLETPEAARKISFLAELPEAIATTRASVSIPATHKLRCILEVWTVDASPVLKYREEVAVESGNIPAFDFALDAAEYECLMWADFIRKDAAVTSVTSADGVVYEHFEDMCFNTENLRNVTILSDYGKELFDTDLCDAFFVSQSLEKEGAAITKTLKMQRPFSKLIVKEKNAENFAKLTKMQATYSVPSGFDVAAGEPLSQTMQVVFEKDFNGSQPASVLFTNYIFTSSSVAGDAMGIIGLSFTTNTTVQCEIPEGSIMLARNKRINAVGELMIGGTVEPEVPEEPEEPSKKLKIGDYFFMDGTWSNELTDANKDKCVGIVYATGAQPGDDIADYGESAAGKSILGYVLSLKNVEVSGFLPEGTHMSGRPYFYKQDGSNFDAEAVNASKAAFKALAEGWDTHHGFSQTEKALAAEAYTSHKGDWYHPALALFEEWKKTAVQAKNASEWYIPSAAQLLQFSGNLFGFKGGAAGSVQVPAVTKVQACYDAFMNAIEQGITKHFPNNNKNAGYYVYSSSFSADPVPYVLQLGYGTDGAGSVLTTKPNYKVQGFIRPVLTIIK